MRLPVVCLLAALLALPAVGSLTERDRPLAMAVIQYGRDRLDPETGLLKDATEVPNVAESSLGYAAACLLLGQELDRGRQVLGKILGLQQTTGPQAGHFPWQGGTGAKPSEEAVLYMAPLLSAIHREGAANLDEALKARLRGALELAFAAVGRLGAAPRDDSRFLLRAAALGTLGAALGNGAPGAAAEQAGAWLGHVRAHGLPAGHSPTLDAARLVSLKWIHEVAPPAARPAVSQALALAAADMALRLHPDLPGLAGAQTAAFPGDYLGAPGFSGYVLHTDFGFAAPEALEPYVMAALVPGWRAPEAVRALLDQPLPRLARTFGGGETPMRSTTTYLAPGFTLGTLSGEVATSTIPVFATFGGGEGRPTMYLFCSPAPCHVQAVQRETTALVSFSFDAIGQGSRRQAWVKLVLGRPEDIEEVICYTQPWNDLATSLGERESLAVAMHGCYVGLTLTRVGPASSQEGAAAKPAGLRWSGEGRKGDLSLTIHARQADYMLPRAINDVRAGFVLEIAPRAAYPSLADFAKHLEAGRLKQAVRTYKERAPDKEKPKEPGVMMPHPTASVDKVYRHFIEQTIEYANGDHSLKLIEDLLGDTTLHAFADGQEIAPPSLWEAPGFSFAVGDDLPKALAPFLAGQ